MVIILSTPIPPPTPRFPVPGVPPVASPVRGVGGDDAVERVRPLVPLDPRPHRVPHGPLLPRPMLWKQGTDGSSVIQCAQSNHSWDIDLAKYRVHYCCANICALLSRGFLR